MKDIYIVLTTERSPDLVEYHVQATEEKINDFDYAGAGLIALNGEEVEHMLYNGQLAENEDENEVDIFSKTTVINLWECYWNQLSEMYTHHHWKQIIDILYP